jgi:hypothetical protein
MGFHQAASSLFSSYNQRNRPLKIKHPILARQPKLTTFLSRFSPADGDFGFVRAWGFLYVLGMLLAVWMQPWIVPWLSIIGLIAAGGVVGMLFIRARATALRPVVCWLGISVILALIPQWTLLRANGSSSGHASPLDALSNYLSVMSALAAFLAVYNARRPGNGAWAWLCFVLILASLIPWLEQSGLGKRARIPGGFQLEFPWNLFLAGLTLTLVCNFLPTRLRLAALVFLVAFAVQIGPWVLPAAVGSLLPTAQKHWAWMLAVAILLIPSGLAEGPSDSRYPRSDRLWTWFRDRWGAVWAMRIIPRFEREAEIQSLPLHLTWQGMQATSSAADPSIEQDSAACAILIALLHRFAEPELLRVLAAAPAHRVASAADPAAAADAAPSARASRSTP